MGPAAQKPIALSEACSIAARLQEGCERLNGRPGDIYRVPLGRSMRDADDDDPI